MTHVSEICQVMANRAGMYSLLGRLYKSEIDAELLGRLKMLRFPVCGPDAELLAGFRQLELSLADLDTAAKSTIMLDELAADFARVFLGAGIAKGSDAAAFPYASVYTSPRKIIMQEARDQAVASFAAQGLSVDGKAGDQPEDHLAILLEFMAFLCDRTQSMADQTGVTTVLDELAEQQRFLEQQLLNWVPKFCADLERHASTLFYQSLAGVTRSWLLFDRCCLESLAA